MFITEEDYIQVGPDALKIMQLAFHPHPQLIRKLFNAYRFGPPDSVTCPSTWPRVDHLVSRLLLPTIRPIKTRFRFGCRSQDP